MNEFYQENNLPTVIFLYNANAIFSELKQSLIRTSVCIFFILFSHIFYGADKENLFNNQELR